MPPPSRKPAAPRRVRRPAAAPVPRLAPVAGPGLRALVYAALRAPADKRAAARLSELGATPVP
ncbi:hypothetical protein, partial [Bordetella pertussis]|uniref:hypothetical protein n=1 Tax=Bordetella pertussis TaxID=520 RepID=UPI000A53DE15